MTPRGYKQTEIGVIPEDWEVKRLAELVSMKTGPFGSTLHKSDYISNGIPLINPMHIVGNKIVPTSTMTLTPDTAQKLSEFMFQAGDIVMGRRGDIGRCAVIREAEEGWICGTGSMIIRCNLDLVLPDFIQIILSSNEVIRRIENNAIGSTMINLNQTVLGEVSVQVPPVAAQYAVAEALSEVDAELSALDAALAKKRDLKQGAMQELLTGQTRLPGFSGAWEVKQLGEIAEIEMGQSPNSVNYNNEGIGLPLIQGNADISNRKTIIRTYTSEITKRGYEGDLIMSVRAPVGEIAVAAFDLCLGRGVCAIRYPNNYLYHYLVSQENSWKKLSKGSTFDSVNSSDIKSIEIYLPHELKEQAAIAAILSEMDAEISTLEAQREKTAALKQGMMQELLTGKTRLI